MNFVEELKWRGMLHQMMPGTDELLEKGMTTAYVGIDPTADSLHIGHLCSVMMLRHFQRAGHKPLALVGGATGMIGDPSGKSAERNLLTEDILRHNVACIKKQLSHFLDFDSDAPNAAELVNNYDWMKDFTFLDFAREVGKHITVNYMMAKDSVKKRLNGEARDGLSFTEFTYQLLQGYDFLHLYETKNCKLQMGGSDQWGNLTSGLDLIHKVRGVDVNVFTSPIITDAQGKKFGKSEGNAVWLDPNKTSPFEFYQYWRNVGDADVMKCIRMLTFLPLEQIDEMSTWQDQRLNEAKEILAYEMTSMVHGKEEAEKAQNAARALFSGNAMDTEHMPSTQLTEADLTDGAIGILTLMVKAGLAASNGEARRLVVQGGVLADGEKVAAPTVSFTAEQLAKGIVIKKGKKIYHKVTL